jgi:hypothetical protein
MHTPASHTWFTPHELPELGDCWQKPLLQKPMWHCGAGHEPDFGACWHALETHVSVVHELKSSHCAALVQAHAAQPPPPQSTPVSPLSWTPFLLHTTTPAQSACGIASQLSEFVQQREVLPVEPGNTWPTCPAVHW